MRLRAFTFDEVRDIVAQALQALYPDVSVLDYGTLARFSGRTFLDVELPVVTYSLTFAPHLARVTDEVETLLLEEKKVRVEEMVPYSVRLTVAAHSDVQAEAEELALRAHRAFGRAPAIGGIGFHIVGVYTGGAVELTGIYTYGFSWEGWIRIAGPVQEAPAITEVDMVAGWDDARSPAYDVVDSQGNPIPPAERPLEKEHYSDP